MHVSRRTMGFTIVELLIVIIVIAILAAIVIVTYQGVQQRADNSSKYSAAETYVKALQSYNAVNGQYPPLSAGSACLGIGYTGGRCGSSPSYSTSDDSSFDAALRSFIGTVPPADNQIITKQDGSTYLGITLTYWTGFMVNGVSNPYFVEYVLYGSNQDCKVSGLVQIKTTWGDMVPATNQKNTFYDSASTTCVIALPNPGTA